MVLYSHYPRSPPRCSRMTEQRGAQLVSVSLSSLSTLIGIHFLNDLADNVIKICPQYIRSAAMCKGLRDRTTEETLLTQRDGRGPCQTQNIISQNLWQVANVISMSPPSQCVSNQPLRASTQDNTETLCNTRAIHNTTECLSLMTSNRLTGAKIVTA